MGNPTADLLMAALHWLQVRSALRGLRRSPGFTFIAVLTLALGIGATTAVFSIVNAVLLRPLPYTEPDQLMAVWPDQFVANREFAFLRSSAQSFASLGAWSPGWLSALTGVAVPRQLTAARLSGSVFGVLGVAPRLGRTFGMEAEIRGQDRVAVLCDDLWRSVFAADPEIVGRSILLNHDPYTVIGVMPRGFQILDTKTDLWIPLTMDPEEFTWTGATAMGVARLRAGVSVADATGELRVLAGRMAREFSHPDAWVRGARVTPLADTVVGGVRLILLVLLGAVAFLLLIAAANVASLLLVRATARQQEFAVRLALGAGRAHLASLLLGESLALACLGGAAGVGLALAAVRLLRTVLPANLPRLAEIGVDGRVLAVAVTVTALTALASGMAPALAAAREGRAALLRDGRSVTRAGQRTRGMLVAVEVALALVLLAGAMLMSRTILALTRVDPGFRADRLLTLTLQPSGLETTEATRAYWRVVLAGVRSLPGVEAAGSVLHLPTSGRKWMADVEIEGRPLATGASPLRTGWQSVSVGYLSAMGIPLRRGRDFTPADGADAPRVVLVNTVLAERLFPQEDPVGRRIRTGNVTRNQWATIVGVVGSVRQDSLNTAPGSELYVPFEQVTVGSSSIVVRTRGDPAALAPVVRERIWSVRSDVPIADVRTMADRLWASLDRPRAVLLFLTLFAGLGLGLGAVGIYGVVAYGATQRAREIGIRVALGADTAAVIGLVVRQGLVWALCGIGLGLPVAVGLSRLLRGLVYGVPTTDPLTFAAAAVGLVLIAAAASFLPARRASRADPSEVLRE